VEQTAEAPAHPRWNRSRPWPANLTLARAVAPEAQTMGLRPVLSGGGPTRACVSSAPPISFLFTSSSAVAGRPVHVTLRVPKADGRCV